MLHLFSLIAAERSSTLFLTRGGFSRVHSTQSFARVMYCRHRDLVSVCLSVCKDVCRNPGGIIKLQGRLLKEGSGQKQGIAHASPCASRFLQKRFIRMQEIIENIGKNSGKYGSISFFLYTSRR